MNSTLKTVLFWALIVVSAVLLWQLVKTARDGQKDQELSLTAFIAELDKNTVQDFTVNGMEVHGHFRNNN